MIDIKNIKNKISLSKNWLLNSGIQNIDQGTEVYGSFNAWYDANAKKFSFAYSEITGYGISTLLYLNKLNNDGSFIDRARIAADWLLNRAYIQNESFFCRYDDDFMDRFCTFDVGMCLNGLANLYRATKNEKYLEISQKVAYWMINKMQKDDGSFYTRHFMERNEFEENGNRWSKQSGSFLAKVSIGLLNLYDILKDERCKEAARKICDFALKFQENDGRFVTDNRDKSTFVHAHCYTMEGLFSAGVILNEKRYIESAANGLNWVIRHQMPNGGFPAYFIDGRFVNVESPDISSQVIRLRLLMEGLENINNINLDSGIKRIFDFQCMDNSKESYGGFISGKAWFYPEYNNAKHINSWVTMFILQAVNVYLNKNKARNFNMLDLV